MNIRVLAPAIAVICVLGSVAPALALTRHQWEAQVGQQEYQTLQQQGAILSQSPYYKILNPIAARIGAIADRQYSFPFHFYLVHMKQPNAFAVPGGNVYVTDSMMTFAQNKEELAGVLELTRFRGQFESGGSALYSPGQMRPVNDRFAYDNWTTSRSSDCPKSHPGAFFDLVSGAKRPWS